MPDRREQPDRLEREINEILSNIEQFPGPDERKGRGRKRAVNTFTDAIATRQRAFMRRLSFVSLSQLMLLSFVIILGSMFFREVVPISWPWTMYAGVILFVTSFTLLMFGGQRRPPAGPSQYWRGRPMAYGQVSVAERVRRWWNRRAPR